MASEVPLKVKVDPDLSGLVDLQTALWDLGQSLSSFARVMSKYTGVDIPADDVSMDSEADKPVQNCPAVHAGDRHDAHDWTRSFPGHPDKWFHCPGLDIKYMDNSLLRCDLNRDHGPHQWTPRPPRVGLPIRCPGRSDT